MMLLNISCVFLCLVIYKLYNYINRAVDEPATTARFRRIGYTLKWHRLQR